MAQLKIGKISKTIITTNQLTFLTTGPNQLPFIIPLPEDNSVNLLKLSKNVFNYINNKLLVGDRSINKLIFNESINLEDQIKITLKTAKQISQFLKIELLESETLNDHDADINDHDTSNKLSISLLFTTIYDDFAVNYKLISKSEKIDNLWQLFFNFTDKLPASRQRKVICISESNTEGGILADYEKVKVCEKLKETGLQTKIKNLNIERHFYKIMKPKTTKESRSHPEIFAILSSPNYDKNAAIDEFDEFFDGLYKVERYTPGERPKLRSNLKNGNPLMENLGDIDKNLIYIALLVVILSFSFAKLMYT